MRSMSGPAAVLLTALAVLAGSPAQPTTSEAGAVPSATAVAPARPNVLLVVTDDQLAGTVRADTMPNLHREMVTRGVSFEQGFVSNSWCCPSRASILSGQYSGTNGVWTTGGPWGLDAWRAHESSTLATWLHAAGYRTGIVGKYMNGFGSRGSSPYTPPGWHTTAITMDLVYSEDAVYYDYDLWEGGRAVHYGTRPQDYATRVLSQKARQFVAPRGDGRPWFLYLAYTAPHGPGVHDPLDTAAGAGVRFPMPPSVCEADVRDKPAFIRNQPPCSVTPTQYENKMRKQQVRMLASVDRGLGQVFGDLRASGQLANTLVIFLSDNGHQTWEHRIRSKQLPYEESVRVPFLVRWDALGAAATGPRRQLAVNTDVAPTVVAAAGVTAHGPFDGRSLLPVMTDPSAPWRQDFLIEHKMLDRSGGPPSYCGVRDGRWKYVYHQTGERELYDLAADPHEMESLHASAAHRARVATMHDRTLQLCRPAPPGWDLGG